MNALFDAFGIDWRLLIINLLNFGLLLAVLWYFLYGPLTKTLESRRQKMAEGVRNADEAEVRLQEIENARGDMLSAAGKDADEVVAKARSLANDKQRELIAQGEASAQALLSEAQSQAAEMKREAIAESKAEVAKLIVLGMERTALDPGRPGQGTQ